MKIGSEISGHDVKHMLENVSITLLTFTQDWLRDKKFRQQLQNICSSSTFTKTCLLIHMAIILVNLMNFISVSQNQMLLKV